jgi:hypothetical protein
LFGVGVVTCDFWENISGQRVKTPAHSIALEFRLAAQFGHRESLLVM